MLIKEIIKRFHEAYVTKADVETLPSNRRIYSKVRTLRSKLISQSVNKKQNISNWNFQTLPCIEMILADINECPCLPDLGFRILKSKHKIPRPLTDLNSHMFKSVVGLDGMTTYFETSFNARQYKKGAKYTKGSTDFFFHNGYIWMNSKLYPEMIPLTGLFEDPLEVSRFINECCSGPQNCTSYLDFDFPVDSSMFDTIIEMGVPELIGIKTKPTQPQSKDVQEEA